MDKDQPRGVILKRDLPAELQILLNARKSIQSRLLATIRFHLSELNVNAANSLLMTASLAVGGQVDKLDPLVFQDRWCLPMLEN